jgi:two-component system nitrate/nitrite response regulator NarL
MRILVVSDVRIVQEGLHSVLAQQVGIDIISTVDMRHATNQSAQLDPDIVLFDAARLESVSIVKELVASSPRTKVVVFGVKETDAEASALAAVGTAGCVRDSAASGEMVRVLEQVLCEGPPGPSGPVSDQADTLSLSPRELQIAQLIDTGLPNKIIGRQLGIEAATVKNHVHNMCEKLKVHRRGEIAARVRVLINRTHAPALWATRTTPALPGTDTGSPRFDPRSLRGVAPC